VPATGSAWRKLGDLLVAVQADSRRARLRQVRLLRPMLRAQAAQGRHRIGGVPQAAAVLADCEGAVPHAQASIAPAPSVAEMRT